jgi:hypothetical protein
MFVVLGFAMRVGKIIGRIGFAFGFLGSLLFYSSPLPLLRESHVFCPTCPYVDIAFATKTTWIGLGLRLGLAFGLAYALVGFGVGWGISTLRFRYRPRHYSVKST